MPRKIFVAIFVIFVSLTLSFAQAKFDSISAFNFNKVLTSEKFGGRKSGTPEGEKASEWIAEKFKEFGLKPFGDGGTYFQRFKILATRDKVSKLTLLNGRKGKTKYSLGDDFAILTNSGSGKVKSNVVFVGYGISAPEKGRDDYAGVDVKGRVVLLVAGVPSGSEEKFEVEGSRGHKIRKAFEKGASAVLYFQGDRPIRGGAIPEEFYTPQMPAFWVGRKVVDDIFYNTGLSFDAVRSEIDFRTRSFEMDKVFEIETEVEKLDGWTKNVVGVIEGSDEVLKNEYIVVGAHMDHNGTDAEGFIYPGADDNASGTCLVMELARSFMANGEKPKRSIIFVLFAGEEQGLLGSRYFVSHLPVPEENIVVMFNFDMVGRGNGEINIAGSENFPEFFEIIEKFIPERKLKNLGKFRAGANSDHYPFQERGIPAFFFISAGQHPEYHRTDDTSDKIQPFVLGEVGNTAYDVILGVANYPESLKRKNRFQKYIYANARTAVYLVISVDSVNEGWLNRKRDELKSFGVEAIIVEIDCQKINDAFRAISFVDSFAARNSKNFNIVSEKSDFSTSPDVLNIIFSAKATIFEDLPHVMIPLSKLGLKFIVFDDGSDEAEQVLNYVNDFYIDLFPIVKFQDSVKAKAFVGKLRKASVVFANGFKIFDEHVKHIFVVSDLSKIEGYKPGEIFVDIDPSVCIDVVLHFQSNGWSVKEIRKVFGENLYSLMR